MENTMLARNSSGQDLVEVRFDIPRDELAVLDGFCFANKEENRTKGTRKLLSDWSEARRHEAIMICRVAGINPHTAESGRNDGESV